MGGFLLLILILVVMAILWTLPIYISVNLLLFVFNIQFHLTMLQAFVVCLLISVIRGMFFKNKEEK